MDVLGKDLRYTLRRLLRSPGFTAVAPFSLALDIGAKACIFALAEGTRGVFSEIGGAGFPFVQLDREDRVEGVVGETVTEAASLFWG